MGQKLTQPEKGGHIRRKISNTTKVTKSVHQNSVTVRQRWAQFGKALNVMGHRNHHCQMKRKIQNPGPSLRSSVTLQKNVMTGERKRQVSC